MKAKMLLLKQGDSELVQSKRKLKKVTYYVKTSRGKTYFGDIIIRNRCTSLRTSLNCNMLKNINNLRTKSGLVPCFWDKSFETACLMRAEELTSKFSHTHLDGASCKMAYPDSIIRVENIASEYETKSAFGSWFSSSEHNKGMQVSVLDCRGIRGYVVLCQDLVQVKMRNFSHFNLPKAQP